MKTLITLLLSAVFGLASLFAEPANSDIDFGKARELMQKRQSGQTLSREEEDYLTRAKALHDQQVQNGSAAETGGIDMQKARQLHERELKGETLSAEEQAYLSHAKEWMAQRAGKNAPPAAGSDKAGGIDWDKARQFFQREQKGETLSAEEQAYLARAKAARGQGAGGGGRTTGPQRKAPEHLTPLCDLNGPNGYEGEEGELYGHGSNEPPEKQRKAAEAELAKIQPLDAKGGPSPEGRIVFISISMSNATQEFSTFKTLADAAPQKSAKVTVVDCAQGGQAMAQWAPPDAKAWAEAKRRLSAAGVTPAQVQTAWIKLANAGPSGSFQEHTKKLEEDTLAVLHNARAEFPNLGIAYLGSRTYAGYAASPLNPEPYAYEGAFAVRRLIQRQIDGDPELSVVKSPLLLWGPYLWADGANGRKIDQLVWTREDFGPDGTHPSGSGREKVAKLLLDFVSKDVLAKSWFAK